jgi:ribosomal protein S18 acetylase RimI-like enzyme
MGFSIRTVRASDWQAFRDLRLRMLRDTPIAYNETYAHAAALPESEWRERAGRGQEPGNISLVAVADDGTWIGIMRGFVSARRGAMLVGVYVDPAWRGGEGGVADALLEGIVDWARTRGDALVLEVHEDNPRAIAFYRRHGFEPTGNVTPYNLEPYGDEIEMRLDLTR